ncbi:MAG: DUF5615 family PIN-like protein [Leptolyngbyaceae cyanobacterium SL_5_9]|nr:DUF5615 family PIN-like protein [Leptolyngbyaceae cyanobacterium SL_5_9]NJO76633.1 DUF5615 family PIN-like protein [Leptolyngbyaceae cyanobacterium RM1_406_9]
MARFYADEQFPRRIVEALQALGHDVLTVQAGLLPDDPPWNQFRANSLSPLKRTQMLTKRSLQLVSTSFSFEPKIDLKALVQCLLLLVQLSYQI